MEIPDQLACLYTAELTETADGYTITVPTTEVEQGSVTPGETVRVAVLTDADDTTTAESADTTAHQSSPPSQPEPPVDEDETRIVEIEDSAIKATGSRVLSAATSLSFPTQTKARPSRSGSRRCNPTSPSGRLSIGLTTPRSRAAVAAAR